MKLFAYEHPSGPVHEVEVTLGDTVQLRRSITVERGCCSPARPAAASMGETRRRGTIVRSRRRRARAVAPSLADFGRSRTARARRDDRETNARRSSNSNPRSSRPCRPRRGNQISSRHRRIAVTASARRRGVVHEGPRHLTHRAISTQALQQSHRSEKTAPLLPRQETGRRRGDARDDRHRAGLHAAHAVRHGERQVVSGAP